MADSRSTLSEAQSSTLARVLGFFIVHVALWTGLNLVVAGDDRVGFDQLGVGSTPWVRQFHVALLAVLVVQVVYMSRRGLWGRVMAENERSTRWFLWIFPMIILVLGVITFANDGVSDAPSAYWIGMTITMLLVGTTEELSFRGIVLVEGRMALGSERRALLLSSALFGLFHLPNVLLGADLDKVLAQVVFTAIIGSGFYALRRVSGSIVPCIVLHAVYDWMLLQGSFS
jgi:membrane protease YdiL (CAAX protease family)